MAHIIVSGGASGRLTLRPDSYTRYDHVLPLHKLWLGYMSEILNIPLDMTLASSSSSSTSTDPTPSAPRFIPTAADPNATTLHHKITKTTASESFDMVTLPGLKSSKEAELHALKLPSSSSMMAKLVKADYHGCLITGTCPPYIA